MKPIGAVIHCDGTVAVARAWSPYSFQTSLENACKRENFGQEEGRPGVCDKARTWSSPRNSRSRLVAGRSALAKGRVFCQDAAQAAPAVLFGHKSLEIGCGLVLRLALARSPFHKEAVAQASEHTHDPNPVGTSNATSIIIVRDIQTLMGAAFNAPGQSIEL